MKAPRTYLNGKSVFRISLIVIGLTLASVFATGDQFHRSLNQNLYLTLGIIGLSLFVFLVYGLYKGVGLKDDYPEISSYTTGDFTKEFGGIEEGIGFPGSEFSGGIPDFIAALVFWIGMTLVLILLLVLVEILIWLSVFIILAILYWVFFRALRAVFSHGHQTKGNASLSAQYGLGYTALYLGWIYGIIYLSDMI